MKLVDQGDERALEQLLSEDRPYLHRLGETPARDRLMMNGARNTWKCLPNGHRRPALRNRTCGW